MRAIVLTTMVMLAVAGTAMAGVTLSVSPLAPATDPAAGLRTFIVSATSDAGEQINTLGQFTVTGNVYQVFNANNQTEWLGPLGTGGGGPKDSYVIFGDYRAVQGSAVTVETINGGAMTEGLGTLTNYVPDPIPGDPDTSQWDGYLRLARPTPALTVDLMKLVIPDGGVVDVSLNLTTFTDDATPTTWYKDQTIQIYSAWDGDTNLDHMVNGVDVAKLALNWQGTGKAWSEGDFNGDGNVNGVDVAMLALNWQRGVVPATPNLAAVPEPGTIALLVAGALCLVGYRLRKK